MGELGALIAKRVAFGFVTIIVISVLIAIGIEALPGDLAQAILGQAATPENVAAFRKEPWSRPAVIAALHNLARKLPAGRHGHLLGQQT